jgi:protein SCO1
MRRLSPYGPELALLFLLLAGLALYGSLTRGFQTVTSDGARRIDMQRSAPQLDDIALIDSSGRPFSLAQMAARPGHTTLITLAYTTCLDICRTTASGQAYLQQELTARGIDQRVQLLTISFDPARDTPVALAAYGKKMKADPARWTFATVSRQADLARLLDQFGIVVLPDGLGGFIHNGAIFVADDRARLVRSYDIDRPDQALADLLPD